MSFQLASTDSITVVLAAAPATNQLPVNTSYVDQGGSGNNLPSLTNSTTAVTIVGSPATGVERLVSQISIPNADTASATVTVSLVRSSTSYRLCKITLQPGYQLFYDGGWKVLDTNGNFLCDVTVTGGSITSNQGIAAALSGAWPVEVTDGTNVLGTSTHPIRIDPTGTTTQPVSIASTVNTNLAQLNGSALAGPTAWGTAPTSGAQVLNVNANIVSGGSGGGNVNVTQWDSVSLGSPSNYGTSPGAVSVIGVNAFVTNLPATQASNQTQLAGTNLGAPSNYGTSPGAVSVQGVNAFVTNTVAVSGTFWQATQPVSLASLPSLAAGTNTIGSVNQASAPWSFNLTQVGGSSISLGAKSTPNSLPVTPPSGSMTGIQLGSGASTNPQAIGGLNSNKVVGIYIVAYNVVSTVSVIQLTFKDSSGSTFATVNAIVSLTASTIIYVPLDITNLNAAIANSASTQCTVTASTALTSGAFVINVVYAS